MTINSWYDVQLIFFKEEPIYLAATKKIELISISLEANWEAIWLPVSQNELSFTRSLSSRALISEVVIPENLKK
uniref:Uncharacterized protein n=1 Tax=Lepeophtheirus salmonis TaxID=72036 RepID=A0A0K2V503_LEPSM